MCEPTVRNIVPIMPSGAQVVVATTPPARQTRTSSAPATACRGANMWPKVENTRSKLRSSNGSASASPSTQSTSTPASAARRRASLNSSGVRSAPVTVPPRCAAGMATVPPLPVPTSITSMPSSTPTRSIRRGPTASISFAISSKRPEAQTARLRCLKSAMGSLTARL